MNNLQIDKHGKLKHFLTIDGLSKEILTNIMDLADSMSQVASRSVKKVPILRGKMIANLFFEASTRTLTTFELAAKRLSADVINIQAKTSSTAKGESLLDTMRNLEAMHIDMFVVRHADSGAAHFIARHAAPHISIINAGDGRHAHPTQAMLDAYTIRQHKKDFSTLTIAIVGDILHSRVARSEILAFSILGVKEIRVIAPKTLLPNGIEHFNVVVYHDLKQGLKDADVIITLRLQKERMSGALLPGESEYYALYGLTEEKIKIAKPDALIMHPGPINRGVEIDSEVADNRHSVILNQVSNGLAIRMAIMSSTMQPNETDAH